MSLKNRFLPLLDKNQPRSKKIKFLFSKPFQIRPIVMILHECNQHNQCKNENNQKTASKDESTQITDESTALFRLQHDASDDGYNRNRKEASNNPDDLMRNFS